MKVCWGLLLCWMLGVTEAWEVGDVREDHITLVLDWAMDWGSWRSEDFCPPGTYAYSFQIKVESEEAADDTSMNGIELYCRYPRDVGHDGLLPMKDAREFTITSGVQKWGIWKGMRSCSEGLLTGLRMKSEDYQGWLGDDTSANDLEMQCNHSTMVLNGGGNQWGYYSSWSKCPQGWAICGLQTKIESDDVKDDTALNDVKMFCCRLPSA